MNKSAHKMKFITLSLMGILGASSSFSMEGQREETPGAPKLGNQTLLSQFATVNEAELYKTFYPELLKHKLNEAINKDKYLKCDLTDHYAKGLVEMLNSHASPEEIYKHLGICKTICEPGASEATVVNNLPQGVRMEYLIIDDLFASVGVKYQSWDNAEMLLIAHKYGVPLKIDSKTGKRVPLVLTPEELEKYQAHHDFRVAIHGFYKDYTRLINAQRAQSGLPPYSDSADDYKKHDTSEKPMTHRERQDMIRNAKLRLAEHERKAEQAREERRIRREIENAQKAKEMEDKKNALALENLQSEQVKLEAEQKKLIEEQFKIQEAQKLLIQQARQNEEKMRLLAEKAQSRQKAEEERKRLEQENAKRLAEDAALARALDKQLNGDEEFAKALHRQLNG